MSGQLLYKPAFIPRRVAGILTLLESEEPEELTAEQIAAIRRILHLDDSRPVWLRITEDGA